MGMARMKTLKEATARMNLIAEIASAVIVAFGALLAAVAVVFMTRTVLPAPLPIFLGALLISVAVVGFIVTREYRRRQSFTEQMVKDLIEAKQERRQEAEREQAPSPKPSVPRLHTQP
jgi:VIT1/CCC1 family predicted Fe2+/Mn2+ transporter